MKKLFFFCFLYLFSSYILNAQPTISNTDLAMFRGNAQLTGVSNSNAVYKLSGVKFTFKTEGPIRSTPAVYNGILYFGSGDNNLYAVDGQSGKEIWHFKTGGEVHSSPAVTNGKVYFTSRDGYLYALSADKGTELWKYKMGEDVGKFNYWDYYLSSPSIENQILYIGSGDGNLYAFDLNTQDVLWKFNAGSRIRTTPAVSENKIVFGACNGCVYAVNKQTGTEEWKYSTDGASFDFESESNDRTSVMCSPAVKDGIVAIGGRDGFLYALDMNTGKQKWKVDHKGSWVLSTAINDGKVFVGTGSALFIQALDENTGIEIWKFKTFGAIFSSLCLANDMIYANDFVGNVYAIESSSGKGIWKFPMGTRSGSTPLVSGGVVYTCSDDGFLYALEGSGSKGIDHPISRKIVYWEGTKTKDSFRWFQNNMDIYIRDYFKSSGYELLDAVQLEKYMNEQINTRTPGVIVFADNIFPKSILKGNNENSLIRRYLNSGGKVALLGLNPSVFVSDSLGVVDSLEYENPGRIFGVHFPDIHEGNGYYGAKITEEGKKWGLRSNLISNGSVNPEEVSTVLAYDEFSKASEWVKNYGGPEGTGLLQLVISRFVAGTDLVAMRTAIEFGIDW
ncbi:hypothetical protein BH10BAC5_BH10BAC5_04090 [soil metagenome]